MGGKGSRGTKGHAGGSGRPPIYDEAMVNYTVRIPPELKQHILTEEDGPERVRKALLREFEQET
jgi:hypothetical protein